MVILIGNIAQLNIKKAVDGRTCLFVNVAVDNETKMPDGTRSKRTNFIPVSVFGSRAEALTDLLHTGQLIMVRAHHTLRENFKLSIVADDVQILSPPKTPDKQAVQQPAEDIEKASASSGDFDDDD